MAHRTLEELEREYIRTPADAASVARYRAEAEREVLGARLAELRRRRGLTQAQLAHKLGIGQSRISKIEKGDFRNLKVDTVKRYAVALGVEIEMVAKIGRERILIG